MSVCVWLCALRVLLRGNYSGTWLSLDCGKVAPAGEGPARHEAIQAAKAACRPATSGAVADDTAWRSSLRQGVLVDFYSSTKFWYNAIILAERGVKQPEVKVRPPSRCVSLLVLPHVSCWSK